MTKDGASPKSRVVSASARAFSHNQGRVEMWRGGVRQNISVAAPFVWRCLSGSTMAPFPHPAHRTGQADFPHPALGQDVTLSRATPSAASEHLLELIGFPISRSFTTYCVCLELRSLPSTGVTRFPRYYEPLRHPRAPGLSLTGFRLVIADHALGLPVFRALSLCTCRRHYPGAASERIASLMSSRRISHANDIRIRLPSNSKLSPSGTPATGPLQRAKVRRLGNDVCDHLMGEKLTGTTILSSW
jgi:hypothetical protein